MFNGIYYDKKLQILSEPDNIIALPELLYLYINLFNIYELNYDSIIGNIYQFIKMMADHIIYIDTYVNLINSLLIYCAANYRHKELFVRTIYLLISCFYYKIDSDICYSLVNLYGYIDVLLLILDKYKLYTDIKECLDLLNSSNVFVKILNYSDGKKINENIKNIEEYIKPNELKTNILLP